MAWIESFEVNGLAGRTKPVEHTLNRNLNIFWGLNGAGKTTLLRILHAALKNDTATLEDLPFDSAEVVLRVDQNDARFKREFSKEVADAPESHDEDDLFLSSDVSIEESWYYRERHSEGGWKTTVEGGATEHPPGYLERALTHSYLPITRVAEGGRRVPRSTEDRKRASDEVFVAQVRERWRDYSLRSFSSIREIQQQGLATVLAILFGGSPNENGSSFGVDDVEPLEAYNLVRSFLQEQNISLQMERSAFIGKFKTSPEHRQVVAEIQTVKHLTDDVLAPQKEFQRIIDSMYRGNKHLVLGGPRTPRAYAISPIEVEINDRSIPLKSLSSGEKQLLQILLEVLSSNKNAVIIDEPELSLHVNWQQQLVTSMQRINGDCQLLLASHSPEIMAEVSDDHIFEL
ncbi:AAA family ATPase [Brachybacterium sp. FME24]|uniref:AAA family ATPase n=1 Tax=Brachybacterium sp. FME24 TaxID=2742605 RepID=UPI001D05110B|nr:AAA family ATPase [Brachybacterium sp. FME24]